MNLVNELGRIAEEDPKKAAIICPDGMVWTYGELMTHIYAVSMQLSAFSQGRVAIQLPNGPHFVAALFGCWHAGATAIPIDRMPEATMDRLILNLKPHALISDLPLSKIAHPNLKTIRPDWVPTSVVPPENHVEVCTIFQTSGSTGVPKSVQQTSHGMNDFATQFARQLGIQKGTKVSWLYSPAFSASMMDILGTLLHGGTLVAFDLNKLGVHAATQWLQHSQIEVLHTVPSVFRRWIALPKAAELLHSVKAVDLGGEPVRLDDVEAWLRVKPKGALLINHLAATEASVIALKVLNNADDLKAGWDSSKLHLDILDENGEPVSVGTIGRLRITGASVSPGYFNPTSEQAASFESTEKGIAYTGTDLAFLDELGQLHLAGRSARRVKISGYGVDLDEVEQHVRIHLEVEEVAIVLREDLNDKIAAWIVPSIHSRNFNIDALRAHVLEALPSYAVPTAWVEMTELPRTLAGKIDRKKLETKPLPAANRTRNGSRIDGNFERLVAEWFEQEIPRLQMTLTHDTDFFSAGGDSLAWASLHGRFERATGNTIPLMELAKPPTIGGIAHLMKEANAGHLNFEGPSPLVTIRKTNTNNQLFLIHGKLGEAFISPRFTEVVDERIGIHVFWAHGVSLERMMTFGGLQDWAECYVEELRKLQPNGPYALGALCIGYTLAFTMADILIAAGQEVLPIVLLDPPADLEPTWRDRYVGLKRRLQFKLLGRKKVASHDIAFYNGRSSQIDDQRFIENRRRFAWMQGQYKKFNGPIHSLSGIRIAAKATLKSKTNMHLKGFEVMECGNNHKEVLRVQNQDFREAWAKFERQAFGFHAL